MTTMLESLKNRKCPDCDGKISSGGGPYRDPVLCKSCGGSFLRGMYNVNGKYIELVKRRNLNTNFEYWIRDRKYHSNTPANYIKTRIDKQFIEKWYKIPVSWRKIETKFQWCHENCTNKWTCRGKVLFFKSAGDAVNFKLTWV